MYLDGVLIEARDLINGVSIVQAERVENGQYFHIELDSHDVVIAEGALAESFIDDDGRGLFHNAHEYRALYPDAAKEVVQYCAPRLQDGYGVEAVAAADCAARWFVDTASAGARWLAAGVLSTSSVRVASPAGHRARIIPRRPSALIFTSTVS